MSESFKPELCEDAVREKDVSDLITRIETWIYSQNRNNADYFIVDKIEELITEYKTINHSVTPQLKTGKWIEVTKDGGNFLVKCDQCGDLELEESYFCPNCGAKMEGTDG